MPAERRSVRDLEVLLIAGAIVVGVVLFARVTGLVPGLFELVAFEPAVIIILIAVTILVLLSALRPRR